MTFLFFTFTKVILQTKTISKIRTQMMALVLKSDLFQKIPFIYYTRSLLGVDLVVFDFITLTSISTTKNMF